MNWFTFTSVEDIPAQWDDLVGDNIFLQRIFLKHLEKVNPCGQTYNILAQGGQTRVIYVDYRLKLNIFTFSTFTWKIPVRIMGIPCSVSKQGFNVRPGFEKPLVEHFKGKEGAKLILNSMVDLPANGGETLPACLMEVNWSNWEEYLKSLRSHYRYRIKKAREKWQQVEIELETSQDFDTRCYQLYEGVFNRSEAKLEKLTLEFFQGLPLPSVLLKAKFKGQLLGFVQLVDNGSELIFLFIGFDHKLNRTFDIYFNLLLEIVAFAIKKGYKTIDLGQTAEETKLKLGSRLLRKGMYLSHSRGFLDSLANSHLDLFSYKVPRYNFHVFKDGGEK